MKQIDLFLATEIRHILRDTNPFPFRTRSQVGPYNLIACTVLTQSLLFELPIKYKTITENNPQLTVYFLPAGRI